MKINKSKFFKVLNTDSYCFRSPNSKGNEAKIQFLYRYCIVQTAHIRVCISLIADSQFFTKLYVAVREREREWDCFCKWSENNACKSFRMANFSAQSASSANAKLWPIISQGCFRTGSSKWSGACLLMHHAMVMDSVNCVLHVWKQVDGCSKTNCAHNEIRPSFRTRAKIYLNR